MLSSLPQTPRDTAVFERSNAAYKKAGLLRLIPHSTMCHLRPTLTASRGLSTPRWIALCASCCALLRSGAGFMFDVPSACPLHAAFAEAWVAPSDRIIPLSGQTRNELLPLSPFCKPTCLRLCVMNASPSTAALCRAATNACAVQELWQRSEQRGYHTRLEGRAATAALREL